MQQGRAVKACRFRRVELRTGPLATCSRRPNSSASSSQCHASSAATTARSRGSQASAIKCAVRRPLISRTRGLSVVVRAEQSTTASDGDVVVMVGDIGGTNARLSLWRTPLVASAAAERIFAKIYPTTLPTFEDVVTTFINEPEIAGLKPKAAALAIAGAIDNNCCRMTNTTWFVDGPKLSKMLGFKVQLLNDFEAVGYGILALPPSDVLLLNGPPNLEEHVAEHSKAPKVVMGPGTGLGAAQLMWDSGEQAYRVWPGEGAHATFAPRGWKQRALSEYVTNKFGHCEIEQVACGSGIELIYEFLQSDEPANRPHLLAGTKTTKDNKAISAAALDGSDPLAMEAVDLFLTIVGQEAGAMALRALAKGGVYIAGGIPPKLTKGGPNNRIAAGALTEGFLMRAGRRPFQEILAGTPLYVVLNDQVGKIGALEYARRLCSQA